MRIHSRWKTAASSPCGFTDSRNALSKTRSATRYSAHRFSQSTASAATIVSTSTGSSRFVSASSADLNSLAKSSDFSSKATAGHPLLARIRRPIAGPPRRPWASPSAKCRDTGAVGDRTRNAGFDSNEVSVSGSMLPTKCRATAPSCGSRGRIKNALLAYREMEIFVTVAGWNGPGADADPRRRIAALQYPHDPYGGNLWLAAPVAFIFINAVPRSPQKLAREAGRSSRSSPPRQLQSADYSPPAIPDCDNGRGTPPLA